MTGAPATRAFAALALPLLLSLVRGAARAQDGAPARLEKAQAHVDEPVRLFITLPPACRDSRLSFRPEGIDVMFWGDTQAEAGWFTRAFVLRARKPGKLSIPPVSIRCGSRTALTPRLLFEALPGSAAPVRPRGRGEVAALRKKVAGLQRQLDDLKSGRRKPAPSPDPPKVRLLRPPDGGPPLPPAAAQPGARPALPPNAARPKPVAPAPAAGARPAASSGFAAWIAALFALALALLWPELRGLWALLGGKHSLAWVPRADEPPPPAAIASGKYELRGRLGQGGMGVVYEALDRAGKQKVAIKKLRQELRDMPRERERFLQEARAVAKLSHPSIIGLREVVAEGMDIYIVFDFIEGKPLSSILHEKGRLPLPECRRILEQVCRALDCAHRARILHRDLKPSNIMVEADGRAKVMDFGIARELKDTLTRMTRTQTILGTPAYMAPEQHLGEGCAATDVYALGVCLYEMLTGKLPFGGPDFLAQKERRRYAPATGLVGGLPKSVDVLIAAILEPDPKKRVADPMEFLASLDSLDSPVGRDATSYDQLKNPG